MCVLGQADEVSGVGFSGLKAVGVSWYILYVFFSYMCVCV